ncbi:uncharacterized protein JCM6883_007178 [Sporobolomyces salmoneus]|uniref:uncharacterized protein n=1 Tax=Sporobolomyces salmoneus TaxID=183962 RepID=UPI003172B2EA
MGDYEHVKMVRAYEREFYQMLECSDCFALNYLDANNWDIIKREAEKIRQKGKDLISTRGRLLAPLHITSALTIASIKTRIEPRLRRPLEARQAELNLLFDMIRKKFRNEGSVWQSDFFRDWTEAVGAELEHRYSRNPAILLEFASFCTIKEGIVEVSLDPFLVVPTDTRPNPYNDPWARLSTDEKIRGFVNRILTPPDAPPSYENLPVHTARSLSRRVGFRQIAIRPDVKTLGLARDGGYWF